MAERRGRRRLRLGSRLFGLWVVVLVLAGSERGVAQPGADPAQQVARIEAAYANFDYAEAEALARTALARFEAFSPDQLVRIHTTLALLLYARGEERDAADQFRAALSLNPDLVLDPLLVSPVTIAFFDEIKTTRAREQTRTDEAEPVLRYVQLPDRRQGATWRSAVLPGWGQRYKGETAKGWVLTGLWVGSLAAGAAAHTRYVQLDQDYQTLQGEEARQFWEERVRPWYKTRGWLFVGSSVVWAYAAGDALLTGGPGLGTGPVEVSPAPGGVRLRYRF